ncbi:MAG TPA: glycosyltransferase family 39 protein [Bacteroidia bacterium]|nr:glycosyltransferase family 39 protein [Bacteroidia bacterium]
MINRKNIVTVILAILLIGLAAVLRFYHILSLPYNNNELSALSRTHYNSFAELMDNGVMTINNNSTGVQVFLYYWTKLFGYAEPIVKMPFIVFGILSVLYVYIIGKDWFNATVGLVCAAYIATLQYAIMYSQLAMPFIVGLFFTLAMVYHWNKIVFKPAKRYDLHWALYVLFAACCAYSHYFNLLLTALVGITGIFFTNRRYIIRYITAGVMIFVLYIPHLHLFFNQLSMGGIGSLLGKPGNDFLLKYFEYVFEFSPYVYLCLGLLVLLGIILKIWTKNAPNRYVFISLSWFIIPALAGFYYSRLVNPVLQYSVLMFNFPFLLFAVLGLLPDLHGAFKAAIVSIVCFVNVYVLVYERKHYDIFYLSPYEQNALLTDSIHRALGKNRAISFMEADMDTKRNEHYYANKYKLDTSFVALDTTIDKVSFADLLEDHPREYLSYASIAQANPVHIPMILSDYPYLVKQYNFYGGAFYIFSSEKGKYTSPYIFQFCNYFEDESLKLWSGLDPKMLNDSIHYSGLHSYKMDSLHEYGPKFSCKLKDMVINKNYLITASAEVYPLGPMDDVFIVFAIERQGKIICQSSSAVKEFIMYGIKKKWVKVYHALELSDLDIDYPDVKVSIYIWNKGRKRFYLDDFEVKTMKGNPIIYGLSEKI